MRYHNYPHYRRPVGLVGALGDSRASARRECGRPSVTQRAERRGGAASGKAIARFAPILVYYAATAALLAVGQDLFAHRVFLSAGPLVLAPDGWVSFLAACVVVLLSLTAGRLYLAAEGGGIPDALLAASLGMSAAAGAYLACYTIQNPCVRLALSLSVAFIAIRAARRWDGDCFRRVVRPLWLLLAVLGFATTAFWSWTTSAAHCDLQYAEDAEERYLAEHIETAALFFDEGAWPGMTIGEKAEALGEIVLVECNYLGVEEPPSLTIGPCPDAVVACYDDSKNRITFSPSYLATSSDGRMVIEAAAHETAHCYQAECVKRGYALPIHESGWLPDAADNRAVERWALEFEGYIPATVDSERYFEQECERTAYRYGRASLHDIESRVNKYHSTGNPYA